MEDRQYFEIIDKKLDEIKKDVNKLFDIHSEINKKVIIMETQLKILWKFLVSFGVIVGGLILKIIYDLVVK